MHDVSSSTVYYIMKYRLVYHISYEHEPLVFHNHKVSTLFVILNCKSIVLWCKMYSISFYECIWLKVEKRDGLKFLILKWNNDYFLIVADNQWMANK